MIMGDWGVFEQKEPGPTMFYGKKRRTSVHGSNGDELCVKAGLLITGWSYKEGDAGRSL